MAGEFEDGKRERFRFRLRAGVDYEVKKDRIKVGFQLRSGNPDNPVSDNQTLGDGLSGKDFSLGEVWAHFVANESFEARLGKFAPSRLWNVSDMQWDGDVTVEGALERLAFGRRGRVLDTLGASIYQYALEESDAASAWLLGAQIRPLLRIGAENELELGIAFDYYDSPQVIVDLSLSGALEGNRITNLLDQDDRLISDFRILSIFADWKNEAREMWPLEILLHGYRNTGASDRVGTENGYTGVAAVGSDNDTAWLFRSGIGRYDSFKRVQVRYTYYYSEPDALLYAYMQSDTRRASNLDGHRVDIRLGMPARSFFHVTYYRTRTAIGASPVFDSWFFDYSIRF